MDDDSDPTLLKKDGVGDDYPERCDKSDENRNEEWPESVTPEETSELESESEPETRRSEDYKGLVVSRSEPRQKDMWSQLLGWHMMK